MTLAVRQAASQEIHVLTGLSADINNKARFFQVPVSVQFLPTKKAFGSFLFAVDLGIPIARKGTDSAFTLEQNLPPSKAVSKKTSERYVSVLFGYRAYLNRAPDTRFFMDLIPLGISWQRFTIRRQDYDPFRYELLDPDIDTKVNGYIAGIGFGFKRGPLTIQSHAYSPLARKDPAYKQSYQYGAPLQLTAGYILFTGRKKQIQ